MREGSASVDFSDDFPSETNCFFPCSQWDVLTELTFNPRSPELRSYILFPMDYKLWFNVNTQHPGTHCSKISMVLVCCFCCSHTTDETSQDPACCVVQTWAAVDCFPQTNHEWKSRFVLRLLLVVCLGESNREPFEDVMISQAQGCFIHVVSAFLLGKNGTAYLWENPRGEKHCMVWQQLEQGTYTLGIFEHATCSH